MKYLSTLLGLVLFVGSGSAGQAFLIRSVPNWIPLERLVKNGERYLQKNPESAEAHYTLSRIHYLGFSQGWTMADGETDKDGPPRVSGDSGDWRPVHPSESRDHRATELALT